MTKTDIYSKEQIKKYHKENGVGFEPPNPASVLEETDVYGETKEQRKKRREKGDSSFEPPNPSSVVEEKPLYKTSKYTWSSPRKPTRPANQRTDASELTNRINLHLIVMSLVIISKVTGNF